MIFQNHHVLQESSETKLHVLTLYIVGVLTSYCRLEYCSSMLEKMAARKWLDSKTLMARLENAQKFLARTRSSHKNFGLLTTQELLMIYCTLEHCSSMLEKLAARKWLGSKPLENFWLELARAMKVLAR